MSETSTEEVRRDTADRHRETEFFNEHDGLHGRAPGEYLDVQEREAAEVARAKTENRKPDFKNLPAVAGTPIVVKERLRETAQATPSELKKGPELVNKLPVDHTTPAEAANRDTAYRDMIAQEDRVRNTGTNEPGPVEPTPSTPIMPNLDLPEQTATDLPEQTATTEEKPKKK